MTPRDGDHPSSGTRGSAPSCRVMNAQESNSIKFRTRSLVQQRYRVARAGSSQSMSFTPSREPRPRGKRALGSPTGVAWCAYVCAPQPRSLSLSLSLSLAHARARVPVMSRRLRGASTLITYPYTRVPTVCLPTDGSNE